MNTTVTFNYGSRDSVKNALVDLMGAEIPGEQIYVDKKENQIKVIIPKSGEPEVRELLGRHNPV